MSTTETLSGLAEHVKQLTPTGRKDQSGFPVDIFPMLVREMILDYENALCYSRDYTSAGVLFAASVGIGNKYELAVQKGWAESAVIWIALVGKTGTAKSHPLNATANPLRERDHYLHRQHRELLADFESVTAMPAQERLAKGITAVPLKPKKYKHIVSDATPEALAAIIEDNPAGIGLLRDELHGLIKDFGRYNKSGEQESYLSMWSRQAISIDRKNGPSIYVHKPFVSIAGTIQPKVLQDLGKDGRSDNGFIDRILFAMPEGAKATGWTDMEVSEQSIANWKAITDRLLDLPLGFDDFGNPKAHALVYSPSSKQIMADWTNGMADRINSENNDLLRGIYSKQRNYLHRFALILQMLYYVANEGDDQYISDRAINGAIRLAEYFISTATRAAAYISGDDPLLNLPENKKRLYSLLPDTEFTTGQAMTINDSLDENQRMSKPTLTGFLKDQKLFSCIKRGTYEKIAA